ncbi:carboxylic ester hydrolase [Aureococcus anophagefferens]|nr:carboxylic ester hydrolase [Aureococcus anophagefferens]
MMMGRRAMVVLCAVAEAARVVTPDGPVVGFAKGGFDAFLGLPFAAPPVGDLRFRAPQRPANWTADRPAVTMGASCLQPGGEFRYGSANDVESRWPSFGAGGDSEPVILVAANSRIGFLGYAAHETLDANAGLLDQTFALEWVQRTIGAFGGDPTRVTIFGEAPGGTSSATVAPRSKGLFARAILESPGLTQTSSYADAAANLEFAAAAAAAAGAKACAWWLKREKNATLKWTALPSSLSAAEAKTAARGPASRTTGASRRSCGARAAASGSRSSSARASSVALRRYGGTTSDFFADVRRPDGASFAACLRSADAADLVRAADAPFGDTFKGDAVAPFVDGTLLAKPLSELVRSAPLNVDSLLGGSNKDEGTEFMDVAAKIDCDGGAVDLAKWAAEMYGGDLGRAVPWLYTEALDLPAPKCRDADDPAGNGTVNDGSDMQFLGSFHGAEVPFVFGDAFELRSDAEKKVAAAMGCYWTSFAATGDPNGAPCAKDLPAWPTAATNNLRPSAATRRRASASSSRGPQGRRLRDLREVPLSA